MMRAIRPLRVGVGAAAGLGLLYTAWVRRRRRGWCATAAEASVTLPGDDLIPVPIGSLTHAVTIRRPPRDVWPWLVQMGAGRAGWYSYDFIDNGRDPSLDHIVPELQSIQVGSVLPAMPGVTEGFTVLRIEPERALVLGWLTPSSRSPVMTWAFVLQESKPGCTRLVVRARASAAYHAPFRLPDWTIGRLVPLGHAVMQRKQLLGIRRRTERCSIGEPVSRGKPEIKVAESAQRPTGGGVRANGEIPDKA